MMHQHQDNDDDDDDDDDTVSMLDFLTQGLTIKTVRESALKHITLS